jgi:hypothetical protein
MGRRVLIDRRRVEGIIETTDEFLVNVAGWHEFFSFIRHDVLLQDEKL